MDKRKVKTSSEVSSEGSIKFEKAEDILLCHNLCNFFLLFQPFADESFVFLVFW